MALTPEQRRLRAQIAVNTRLASEDPVEMTAAARKAALDRFEKQVDPDAPSTPPNAPAAPNTPAGRTSKGLRSRARRRAATAPPRRRRPPVPDMHRGRPMAGAPSTDERLTGGYVTTRIATLNDLHPAQLRGWALACAHLRDHGLTPLPPPHVARALAHRGWW